ncbi:hypothetical protein ACWA5G_22175 (plasmid) [Xanthomonas axonopodis pv. ricini]|uniref:hypothetical protein n=1 Tax=Xanthomonas TaxID=338 RepID=UPI0024570A5A|nr:hypothetical protein [Xanthomonas euvesicatoria]MDH4910165.1 hypothetical protein [Xanthomonas euvesicatoria]
MSKALVLELRMKRESGHFNRSAQRRGGDRHVLLRSRSPANEHERLQVLIGVIIDSHPDWPLSEVGNTALLLSGATIEKVAAVLRDYVSDGGEP